MSVTELLPGGSLRAAIEPPELSKPPREIARLSAVELHLAWLDRLETAFERVVLRSLKRAINPVARHFNSLTAQGEPEPVGESFVSADDLAQIRTLWAEQVAIELLPLLGETYMTGAQGVSLAIAGVSMGVPDVVSVGAQEWLTLAENRLVRVGDTAWLAARSQLLEGFQRGESIDDLAKRVRSTIDVTEARARAVARTEVIGASNAGSYAQAHVMGATTKTWLSTHDARTRRTHASVGDQTVALDDAFDVGGARLRFPHDPLGPAKETVNCVIGSTRVATPLIQVAMRSWYDGDVIEIGVATGDALTVTPNHPILTTRGWVAAQELIPGDHVICGDVTRNFGKCDVERVPTEISEIYYASTMSCTSNVREAPANFHGERRKCEVYVVAEDRQLGLEVIPASEQELLEFGLTATDLATTRVGSRDRRSLSLGITGRLGNDVTSTSIVSTHGQCTSFLNRGVQHALVHSGRASTEFDVRLFNDTSNNFSSEVERLRDHERGLTSVITVNDQVLHRFTDIDALPGCRSTTSQCSRELSGFGTCASTMTVPAKQSIDGIFADVEIMADRPRGFSVQVALDDVVSIRRIPYSGHVYNLSTTSGWYTISGSSNSKVISHNCRCTLLFDDKPLCACTPEWVKKEAGSLTSAGPSDCGCSANLPIIEDVTVVSQDWDLPLGPEDWRYSDDLDVRAMGLWETQYDDMRTIRAIERNISAGRDPWNNVTLSEKQVKRNTMIFDMDMAEWREDIYTEAAYRVDLESAANRMHIGMQDADPVNYELYRGMRIDNIDQFTVDAEIEIGMSSFSTGRQTAMNYAQMNDKYHVGETPVLIKLTSGSRAYQPPRAKLTQGEHVLSGTLRVTDVSTDPNGLMMIEMEHV